MIELNYPSSPTSFKFWDPRRYNQKGDGFDHGDSEGGGEAEGDFRGFGNLEKDSPVKE